MTPQQEEIFTCVLQGDVGALQQRLESVEETQEKENLLSGADEMGRSALMAGSLLGRSASVSELVTHGAPVNQQTVRGYTALHLAACWGHVATVQILLNLGADTKAQNFRGERPIDLAKKYSRQDCENCLILGDAKQDFTSYLAHVKSVISESETSLNKEERTLSSRVLAANTEWLQSVMDPHVSDYINQREDLEACLQHVLNKLANSQ